MHELLRLHTAALGLETVRILGVLVAAPLAWSAVPMRARAALAIVLAIVAHGQGSVGPELLGSVERLAVAAPMEFLVGLAMGFVVRLAVAVAEIAADVIAPVMGLSMSTLVDPATALPETGLSRLFRLLAVLLSLVVGMHRVLIGSLLTSFRLLPPGAPAAPGAAWPALLELSTNALAAGVRLALPVVAVLFLVHLALGFVSRAAPSMQIFSVGFAVTLVVGGFVLAMSLPDVARELMMELSELPRRIETVFAAVAML